MEVIEKCKTDKEKFFNQIKKQAKFNNVSDSKLQEKLNQLNDKFQSIFEKYTKLDDEEGYKREIKSVADEIEVVEKQINKIKSEEYRQQQIRKEFDRFVGRLQVLPENQLDLIRLVFKRIDIKTITSSSEFTFDYEIL